MASLVMQFLFSDKMMNLFPLLDDLPREVSIVEQERERELLLQVLRSPLAAKAGLCPQNGRA